MAHDAVSGAPQAVGFDFVEQLRRQLKAEIYRSLLRNTSGSRMVTLGDVVVRLLRVGER